MVTHAADGRLPVARASVGELLEEWFAHASPDFSPSTRLGTRRILDQHLVDIAADLNTEDETGFIWTFLDEARDPDLIVPGAIVVAGDADAPGVTEVVDIVDKPGGKVVHLRLLPGAFEDYEALVRRTLHPA